jgi:Flp pilus assembly protein TadB
MPRYIDSFTMQFHGMERDELEYARDRYLRSARARRRAFRRLWLRNRAAVFVGATVAIALLSGVALILVRVLGTGLTLNTVGPVVAIIAAIALLRWRRASAWAERWSEEEQAARDLYEMDRDSASYAARLLAAAVPTIPESR